jgi:integrase
MSDQVKVTVASFGPQRCLMMTYRDPTSGKKVARSTGTRNRQQAERQAAVWEDELRGGRYAAPSRVTWQEFRERFNSDKLAGMPESSRVAYNTALDHLERVKEPDRLASLTAAALSDFQGRLRKAGMKETTLARHLRHIKAALRWGARVGLVSKAPTIEIPRKVKGQRLMKGRPITSEEFDRLLLAAPKLRPNDSAAWVRLLTGLWLSGLRLAEGLALSWDWEAPFSVDLGGKHPRFRILAEAQKANRDEKLPMTPDFAEWLMAGTPEGDRTGRVFPIVSLRGGQPIPPRGVGQIVSAIGKKAGVVVNKAEGKYASAHDLRRAFGTRWSKKTMPAVLKRLMRHADIGTTMGYYVDLDADDMADDLWAGHQAATPGNTLATPTPKPSLTRPAEIDVTSCLER